MSSTTSNVDDLYTNRNVKYFGGKAPDPSSSGTYTDQTWTIGWNTGDEKRYKIGKELYLMSWRPAESGEEKNQAFFWAAGKWSPPLTWTKGTRDIVDPAQQRFLQGTASAEDINVIQMGESGGTVRVPKYTQPTATFARSLVNTGFIKIFILVK